MKLRSICSLTLCIAAASSFGETKSFTTTLTGAQEVPAVASAVTANLTFSYDTVSFAYTLTGSVSGLFSSNISGFHIHRGAAGTNGNVIIDLGASSFSLPNGGTISKSGTVVGSTVAGSFLSAQEKVDYILAGNAYANMHTANFPGGEIRGQLAPVPEPATMLMLGFGTLSLLRKRKKAL